MSKEYRIDLEGQEAIIQHPADIELSSVEARGLVGWGLQKAIIEGNTRVTERVWPCLYCGRKFGAQARLMDHFDTNHKEQEALIRERFEKIGTPAKGEGENTSERI